MKERRGKRGRSPAPLGIDACRIQGGERRLGLGGGSAAKIWVEVH